MQLDIPARSAASSTLMAPAKLFCRKLIAVVRCASGRISESVLRRGTIAAGENQGITVEVTTTKSTVPGTYTGVFVLDLDGQKQEIPVTVEVWDILYEGRRSFQSSFLLYRNTLVSGEYEASDELVERYTDFLLDYNVNTYVIKDAYTVEEEVAELVRLFENENYNSFCIPRISST